MTLTNDATEGKGATIETVTKPKETVPYGIKVKSKEVWIRHKPSTLLPFQNADVTNLNKIGSSFSKVGQDVLRGITLEEEVRYLKDIIGVSPTNQNWEKATKDYWSNLTKTVPAPDKDGGGGLKLEIGRIYSSQEDEDFDEKQSDETLKKGKPISAADYVLWRYCLVYNRVANSIDLIHMSPKIDFYIYSKEEEIATKKTLFKVEKEANQLFYSKLAERNWVDWVLRLFVANDKQQVVTKVFIKDLDKLTPDEKDIELKAFVDKYPERFVTLGNDKSLETKAFIELAVAKGVLTRLPNTDTIQTGDVTIGNTIQEAVGYLTNPKNAKTFDTIKAQVNLTP